MSTITGDHHCLVLFYCLAFYELSQYLGGLYIYITYMLFFRSRTFYIGKRSKLWRSPIPTTLHLSIFFLGNVNYAHSLDMVCGCLFCLTHAL
jgi:hypothetical protein